MRQIIKWMCMAAVSVAAMSCSAGEMEEPKAEPLSAPSVKLLDGDVIGWDHVSGAVYYIPNINGVDQERTAENTMDLSVFGAGEYSVKIKAVGDGKKHLDSPWSEVFTHRIVDEDAPGQEPEPDDPQPDQPDVKNLATPVLSAVLPAFASPSQAYVSWKTVENADSYIVKVDGAEASYEDCRVDLSGVAGEHTVTVQAVNTQNPEEYPASETASIEVSVRNYGTGTEADPFLIYTVEDWNQFADVINTAKGTYMDEFVALAQDLDCTGAALRTVGTNSTKNIAGTFDGKGKVIRNASLGGADASVVGLFAYVRGTVKNLVVENCTIVSGADILSRSAVISGGQLMGRIENCTIRNSTVTLSNASNGSYGGIVASEITGVDALIAGCIVEDCTVNAAKDMAGGICGSVKGDNAVISDCHVRRTSVTARNSSGGIVGLWNSSASLKNCISEGNEIFANISFAGGIVGQITAGVALNNVSDDNAIGSSATAKGYYAGGIAGQMTNGNVINNLSKDCRISNGVSAVKDQYMGLVIGSDEKESVGFCKNNVVASGCLKYGSAAVVGKVGLITGVRLTKTVYDTNYYNAALVDNADATGNGRKIIPLTGPVDTFEEGALKHGGSNPIGEGYEPALSDLHTVLNANVETLSAAYPDIRKWQAVSGSWPVIAQNQ